MLEEIYHPPDHSLPEQELRTWVKDWLAVEIPPGQGGYRKEYATNLAVVKGEWRAGWAGWRERSWGDGVDVEMGVRGREEGARERKEREKKEKTERERERAERRENERLERERNDRERAGRDRRDRERREREKAEKERVAREIAAARPWHHPFYNQTPYYPIPYNLPPAPGVGMPYPAYNMGGYHQGGYGGWDRRGRGRGWGW